DLVQQSAQRCRYLEALIGSLGRGTRHCLEIQFPALHGRSQKSGPTVSVKSDVATKKPSSSTLIGSWGSLRLAGPKTGLALSVIRNCDWWQGQSRRLVCCS